MSKEQTARPSPMAASTAQPYRPGRFAQAHDHTELETFRDTLGTVTHDQLPVIRRKPDH
jgi:hypothetical protein